MSAKRPVSSTSETTRKRARKGITLDVKLDVLRRFDAGESLSSIARAVGLATSTIATIKDNREKIRSCAQVATPLSARTLYFHRSELMITMERLLSLWMEDQAQRNVPLNTMVIQAKAKSLYEDLVAKEGGGSQNKPFQASKGWFDRFRRRFNLHNIKLRGEAASADVDAATTYPRQLKEIIDEGGYLPQQVFNIDETGLFWKRLPDRTFVSKEEKCASGFKAAKDRLTLLLGTNAAGDCKLKPLLVYSFENPRALKGCAKSSLPVVWRSNRKAWMTMTVFEDWFVNVFCPAVERYCAKENIGNKVLLLMDNAPGHQVNLNDTASPNVRVEFLPKNTTALIQPLDQGIISTFKRYYLRRTFRQLIAATDREDKATVRDFWKKYNIKDAIDNIADAWNEVQKHTINSCWKSLWPECVHGFTDFEPSDAPIDIPEIAQLARQAGFTDIEDDDVIQLLESQGEEMSNEDLIMMEQQRELEDVDATEEQATPPQLTANDLREFIVNIEKALQIINNKDPNRELSLKVSRGVNDAVNCYKELLKEKIRQKQQTTLDAFLARS